MKPFRALLVVDVQNDFCEGGSLAVPKANKKLFNYINGLIKDFRTYPVVFFSRDWHKPGQKHFASNAGVDPFAVVAGETFWPDHCVEYTEGARFHPELRIEWAKNMEIITKGNDADKHPYSAIQGRNGRNQPFLYRLNDNNVYETTDLDIVGLAFDYCVKDSALDAAKEVNTRVLMQGTRSINPANDDAIKLELTEAGIEIIE